MDCGCCRQHLKHVRLGVPEKDTWGQLNTGTANLEDPLEQQVGFGCILENYRTSWWSVFWLVLQHNFKGSQHDTKQFQPLIFEHTSFRLSLSTVLPAAILLQISRVLWRGGHI